MTTPTPKKTEYGTPKFVEQFATGDLEGIYNLVVYILWESSTEFMVNNGMPTDDEVRQWIAVLKQRPDIDTALGSNVLLTCIEYFTEPNFEE